MRTEADEKLDLARDYVRGAIENLAAIVIAECRGAEEFTTAFADALHSSLNDLLNIRGRLK